MLWCPAGRFISINRALSEVSHLINACQPILHELPFMVGVRYRVGISHE